MEDISPELDAACEVARDAGKILLEYFGETTSSYKEDKTIVTEADYESEEYIINNLKKQFPDYSFLSEEAGRKEGESDYTWVIDPLDGTTNYSIGNPFFNVCIALCKGTEILTGVVYYPPQDELFYAEKGKGAYLNGEMIKVSDRDDIKESVHSFCHPGDEKTTRRMFEIFQSMKLINSKVRQIGSAALELSFVACGRLDSFMMLNINRWDVAAGALLVDEAAGQITDFEGDKFDLGSDDLLASNGKLHDRILNIIEDKE